MELTDRHLKCSDCGAEFVFTAGEQLFFHDKQFLNEPRRCKQCKAKRANGKAKACPETRTICAQCGEETTVPFKPIHGRPVFCRLCFTQQTTPIEKVPQITVEPFTKSGNDSQQDGRLTPVFRS